jgi:osmotically-inducible protein OsmY
MTTKDEVLKQVHSVLEIETRINLHRHPIHMNWQWGALTLEGYVASVAAKKLAVRHAATVPGVASVVDHLRVHPSEHRGDGDILSSLLHFIEREAELRNCTLRVRDKGRVETLHEVLDDDSSGEIEFSSSDGQVCLDGHVISLSHKRMAEALAWWSPGCCNVINRLEVMPAEDDNDDEITDALRLVLEMDPLISHVEQIGIRTRNAVVTLNGVVPYDAERRMIEIDAWCICGIKDVLNNIEVRS